MASEFARNNPFKKGNLVNWMSKVQGYQSVSAQILKKGCKIRILNIHLEMQRNFLIQLI